MDRTCASCGVELQSREEGPDASGTALESPADHVPGDRREGPRCDRCQRRLSALLCMPHEGMKGTFAEVLEEYLELAGGDDEPVPPPPGSTRRSRSDQLTEEIAAVIRRIGGPVVLWRDDPGSVREYWVWGDTGNAEMTHTSYDVSDFTRLLNRLETEGQPLPTPALGRTVDGSPLDRPPPVP
jgi:hypothetical protein